MEQLSFASYTDYPNAFGILRDKEMFVLQDKLLIR